MKAFFRVTVPILCAVGILFAAAPTPAADSGDTSRCMGLSLEEAGAILGVSSTDLVVEGRDMMVSPQDLEKGLYRKTPHTCTFRSQNDFLRFVSYITYVHSSKQQARLEWERMKEGFETVSAVDAVPGVGDEAFWAGDSRFRRMVAVKGAVVVDVLNPKDFDLQKRILKSVLASF